MKELHRDHSMSLSFNYFLIYHTIWLPRGLQGNPLLPTVCTEELAKVSLKQKAPHMSPMPTCPEGLTFGLKVTKINVNRCFSNRFWWQILLSTFLQVKKI